MKKVSKKHTPKYIGCIQRQQASKKEKGMTITLSLNEKEKEYIISSYLIRVD